MFYKLPTDGSPSAAVMVLEAGLGIRSSVFWAKNERMSDSLQKNEQYAHSLIWGERPERIAHLAHRILYIPKINFVLL